MIHRPPFLTAVDGRGFVAGASRGRFGGSVGGGKGGVGRVGPVCGVVGVVAVIACGRAVLEAVAEVAGVMGAVVVVVVVGRRRSVAGSGWGGLVREHRRGLLVCGIHVPELDVFVFRVVI